MLVLLLLLGGQAVAASPDTVQQAQAEALDLEGLERSAQEQAVDLPMGTGLEEGLQTLLEKGGHLLGGSLGRAVRSGVLLLVTAALCGLTREVQESMGQSGGLDAAALTAALAITAVAVSDVRSMVGLGRQALSGMDQFSQVLLPTMAAAAAAGGAPGTAAARQLATVLFSDLLLTAIDKALLPMVYAYVAASAAHAALGNDGLKRLAALLKWGVTTALTAILLVFVGYLTVSGAIAGTADAMALRAAKMTISGMVPVVGDILSDAAGTILAGAGILRGTVGVFGLLAVLAICLGPFLELGIHYLVYKLAAALAATVSGGPASSLIDSIGGAFGLVLGMTGSGALLLLVSVVSAISMTAGG